MTHAAMRQLALITAAILAGCAKSGDPTPAADHIFTGGRIYTANADREIAEAMAIRGNDIVAVGTTEAIEALAGADTVRHDLDGRLVLPGLHDAHLHPIGAMPVKSCSLENVPTPLSGIYGHVADCFAAAPPEGDAWFSVELWNFAAGNQPDGRFGTIREALDAVSTTTPIILLGSDGHHYGVNSAALAMAKNAAGEIVGFSRETLARDFPDLAEYIGVDETGEPNGRLTEDYALTAIGAANLLSAGLDARRAHPELMMEVTLPRGITSFLDAAADPAALDIYDLLVERGAFHGRATLALYLDPTAYADDAGRVDFTKMMADASAIRTRYDNGGPIKANFLKLFADGVLEGDPLSTPPTLPNAAMSRDYLQPIFTWNPQTEWVDVTGYVDPASSACANAATANDVSAFIAENGFHPGQCATGAGVLQYERDVILDYVNAGDAAGFTFHIHAIGDRGVQAALDAIEGARAANGKTTQHIVTHLQVVRPEDFARFANLDAYASLTFAWATRDPQYDTTVVPFVDRVDGPAGFYDPDGYYMKNVYPAESIRNAGGVIIAGSDAPVDTKDPRPFINIEGAVARDINDLEPLNGAEALTIFDAIDAYTINAAKALQQADIAGSLETGKRADFILVDQDVIALAGAGEAAKISDTRVLETWFDGALVYELEDQ